MLDTFIIEEIRRREEEEIRSWERRPAIPCPADQNKSNPARQDGIEEESGRGVLIIDYSA